MLLAEIEMTSTGMSMHPVGKMAKLVSRGSVLALNHRFETTSVSSEY